MTPGFFSLRQVTVSCVFLSWFSVNQSEHFIIFIDEGTCVGFSSINKNDRNNG